MRPLAEVKLDVQKGLPGFLSRGESLTEDVVSEACQGQNVRAT